MATAPNPARIGVMPRSPGPNSSEREKSEWMDAATQIIEDLTFALQGVLGNPSINLESSTVISDLSDTAATALPPDTTGAAGVGTKASRYDHTHATTAQAPSDLAVGTATSLEGSGTSFARNDHTHATPIGSPANVGTAAADGSSGTFSHSDHVHDLSTAGDTNYLRRDGGNTVTGNILPDGNETRILGSSGTHYSQVWTKNIIHDSQLVFAAFDGVDSVGFFTDINLNGAYCNATASPNAWQSGAVANKLVALEEVTSLNELAAASGAYDMDGNTFTDFGGCTSSNAALLELKADITGASGVVGMRFTWNEGTVESDEEWIAAFAYNDGSSTDDKLKIGFSNQLGGNGQTTMWAPVSTGEYDAFNLVCGDDPNNSDLRDTNNCGLMFLPSYRSGSIWVYTGATIALKLEKSVQNITIANGWTFSAGDVLKFRAALYDEPCGTVQFGLTSTQTLSSGHLVGFYRSAPPGPTASNFAGFMAGMDYRGYFYAGQAGDAAQAPGDGGFFASGWKDPSTSVNQTGGDCYIGAGVGTGNSAVKGDIFFQTPDAGASGTTVQSLTTKATIFREGGLQMTELSADPSDPPEGSWVIWMGDGTGTGDDGDILVKVTAGGSTITSKVVDYSSPVSP